MISCDQLGADKQLNEIVTAVRKPFLINSGILGMMYWTSTGLLECIENRNGSMWMLA